MCSIRSASHLAGLIRSGLESIAKAQAEFFARTKLSFSRSFSLASSSPSVSRSPPARSRRPDSRALLLAGSSPRPAPNWRHLLLAAWLCASLSVRAANSIPRLYRLRTFRISSARSGRQYCAGTGTSITFWLRDSRPAGVQLAVGGEGKWQMLVMHLVRCRPAGRQSWPPLSELTCRQFLYRARAGARARSRQGGRANESRRGTAAGGRAAVEIAEK